MPSVFARVVASARRLIFRERRVPDEPIAPARDMAAKSVELDTAIEMLLVDLHRLCGVDRVDRAALRLEAFLRLHDRPGLDERMHQRLQHFQDKRLMLQHSWHHMNRLIAAGKLSRAWGLMRESLDVDAAFRPGSADDLLTLIRAAEPSDARCVERLLADFERAYPNSERLGDALFERAKCAMQLGQRETVLELLGRIEAEFPRLAESDEHRAFAARARRNVVR